VSEQFKEKVEYLDHMQRIEKFFAKWSDFSVSFVASPGPLYTAGANSIADSIRREAKEALESFQAVKEEVLNA